MGGRCIGHGLWSVVCDRSEQQFIHVNVGQFDPVAGNFRMAFCLERCARRFNSDIRVFGSKNLGAGFNREPLSHRLAWRLRMPDPSGGQRMVLVVALDIELEKTLNRFCHGVQSVVYHAECCDGRECSSGIRWS